MQCYIETQRTDFSHVRRRHEDQSQTPQGTGGSKPSSGGGGRSVDLHDYITCDHMHGVALSESDRRLLELLAQDHPRQELHVPLDRWADQRLTLLGAGVCFRAALVDVLQRHLQTAAIIAPTRLRHARCIQYRLVHVD